MSLLSWQLYILDGQSEIRNIWKKQYSRSLVSNSCVQFCQVMKLQWIMAFTKLSFRDIGIWENVHSGKWYLGYCLLGFQYSGKWIRDFGQIPDMRDLICVPISNMLQSFILILAFLEGDLFRRIEVMRCTIKANDRYQEVAYLSKHNYTTSRHGVGNFSMIF